MSALVLKKGMVLSGNIEDYPEGIILPVDKPYCWTSADVICKIKWAACRHFGRKNLKVGHAGTLDPLATGELLVCIGKATRLAQQLQAERKEYIAGVTFGATTASYDLEKEPDRQYPTDGVNLQSLEEAVHGFIGEQEQVAPLFSAKSVDGVRAYETARRLYRQGQMDAGDGVLHSSRITIYGMEVLAYAEEGFGDKAQQKDGRGRIHVADISHLSLPQALIRVECSKGTYIRALARDLGEALGSGAFLHSLRRTKTGSFRVEEALDMDQAAAVFQIL